MSGALAPITADMDSRKCGVGAAEGEATRGGVVEDGDARDTWRSAAIGPASNLVLTIGQADR